MIPNLSLNTPSGLAPQKQKEEWIENAILHDMLLWTDIILFQGR